MDTQDLLIDEKPFHWPMVQGEHVDNSKSAAATALIAFLQQKLVDWQFKNLLVMGEQVVTGLFVAPDEANSDSDNGDKQNLGPSLDPDTSASDSKKIQVMPQSPQNRIAGMADILYPQSG